MAKNWKKDMDKGEYKEQQQQKVKDAMERLDNGVKALANSEGWKSYLNTQKRFRKYSFNNTMLIQLQFPEATYIAGFKTWLKMGRQVLKGSVAIYIFAPRPWESVETDASGKEVKKKGVYFVLIPVFDISQTEAIPDAKKVFNPPATPEIHVIDGDDMEFLLAELVKYSEEENKCPVSFVTSIWVSSTANGCYYHDHRIEIKNTNPINQQVKTLVHEIAHSKLHKGLDSKELDRADRELEAESVAYIVLNTLGFDTSDYSFGYLASWAGGYGKDFHEELKKIGARIQKASSEILDYLSDFINEYKFENGDDQEVA